VPEPVVVATPAKKGTTPIQVNIDDVRAELPEPAGAFVVGNGVVDEVSASKIIYKNELARKSLSVHHLQRRLNELGYTEAYKDKDGYFGDKTRLALARFQTEKNLEATGQATLDTLKVLFAGDANVVIVD
jgi:peptidoglycan hydrolase-like protein with peptidoglycan-binding domain